MQAKLWSIYDEGAKENTSLIGAKGLSVMAEVDGQRTLFDVGMRGRYLEHNLAELGMDPESIDRVVVSHGSRENAGGLFGLLKNRNAPVDVYSAASSLGEKKLLGATGLYVPSGFSGKANLITVAGWVQLSENLFITPPLKSGASEECYLIISTRKGPVIIGGRSAGGPEAVLDAVASKFGRNAVAYVGGVQLGKKEKKKAKAIADAFSSRGCTDLYLNHCTTELGITEIRTHMGLSAVSNFYAGTKAEFEV